MEHVSNLLNTSSLAVKREENKYDIALDPHVTEVVNKLFAFFYGICRGFEKQYHDPKRLNIEKTQWIRAFMDIDINTLEKVQLGVQKCRLESPIYTPTIKQFTRWCRPSAENLGFPGKIEAFKIACAINQQFSSYSHPDSKIDTVIRHVVKEIGSSELREMSSKNAKKVFEHNYDIACRQYAAGEISSIAKSIEDKTEETKELEKQRSFVRDEFKHINAREQAIAAMKLFLTK